MMQSTLGGRPGRIGRTIVRRLTRLDPLAYLPAPRLRAGDRPTVGLVGFYGHGNYGDELFLDVFREHLGPAFELDSLLDPLRHRSLPRRLGAGVRGSNAIVIGGGDLVIPWSIRSRYWDAAYLRRPVFVVGVGVPLWRQPVSDVVERLSEFFRHPSVRFVGTRDAESTAWVQEHLRPSAPVVTAPDLVCGMTLPPVDRPAGPPIFGVAVRSRREADDLTHVRRLCERATELGYRVRRIVLATGDVRRRDLEATARLDLPDTELVSSDDLAAISRAIGECTAMATMKFHGVVVATMYGVPAIAMMPTNKTRNFMRRIDRLDLLSAFNAPDLPAILRPDLAPIADHTRVELRGAAVAHLVELRERIQAASAESRVG
jgi:polysaccharide pyruvyl transferase WcaK-like protein